MKKSAIILCATVLSALVIPFPSKALELRKINSGDTVFSILKKYRFSPQQINLALKDKILPKSFALIPGKKYVVLQKGPQFKVKFYDNNADQTYIFWRTKESAGSRIEPANYQVKIKTISGKIYGSLIGSLIDKVKDKHLAYRLMDAYVFQYNLRRDLQRGAEFKVTYEEKYEGDRFIRHGEILEASLELNGQLVTRHFVEFPDGGAFVSPSWDQDDRPLYSPAAYSRFSSLFSYRRRHPLSGRVKPHLGIDYELPLNAKIYAAAAGRVLRRGKNRAAGNYVVLRHHSGLETYYNHLAEISPNINPGAYVKVGQLLGYNGCTGYCTKPHLHFSLKKNGRWVNPIKMVKSYPYHQRLRIRRHLAQLD